MLWDIAGFYESVLPEAAAEAVIREGVPIGPAALSFWGHASQRRLRLHDVYSKRVLTPRISLPTVCMSSTSLARSQAS